MKVLPLLLVVVATATSCNGASESTPSAASSDAATGTQSLKDLSAIAELLPVALEPTELIAEDDPPRLVLRVGVAFQTMEGIIDSIDAAVIPAGFARSDGDDLAWTSASGVRIEAPGRPTLLTIRYDD